MKKSEKTPLFIMISIMMVQGSMSQLPFFLQRFRPIKHSLLASGSSPYSSSFGPSSSFFSRPYSSASSSYGSPSSIFSGNLGSLPFGSSGALSFGSPSSSSFGGLGSPSTSFSSLNSPPTSFSSLSNAFGGFGSLSLPSSNYGSSLGTFGLASPNYGTSSFYGSSPGFLPTSLLHASSSFNSPSVGGLPSSKFGSSTLSPSSLGSSSLLELGTANNFDTIGSFDHGDLLDGYPGFSNEGFAKDLNLAASQTFKFQAPPPLGNEFVFLRRAAEKN